MNQIPKYIRNGNTRILITHSNINRRKFVKMVPSVQIYISTIPTIQFVYGTGGSIGIEVFLWKIPQIPKCVLLHNREARNFGFSFFLKKKGCGMRKTKWGRSILNIICLWAWCWIISPWKISWIICILIGTANNLQDIRDFFFLSFFPLVYIGCDRLMLLFFALNNETISWVLRSLFILNQNQIMFHQNLTINWNLNWNYYSIKIKKKIVNVPFQTENI